ncbi:MAG: hypothetical protein ACXAEN_27380, partial [Candidatus Thorarchaeota archaeon]
KMIKDVVRDDLQLTKPVARSKPPVKCAYCEKGPEVTHWYWNKDDRYAEAGRWRPRCKKREADARYRGKKKQQ